MWPFNGNLLDFSNIKIAGDLFNISYVVCLDETLRIAYLLHHA